MTEPERSETTREERSQTVFGEIFLGSIREKHDRIL